MVAWGSSRNEIIISGLIPRLRCDGREGNRPAALAGRLDSVTLRAPALRQSPAVLDILRKGRATSAEKRQRDTKTVLLKCASDFPEPGHR